jgi:hypothetical protein
MPPALAQDQGAKQIATHKAWTAWTGSDADGPTCYISAAPDEWGPKEIKGKKVNRGPIHFLIIDRKGLGTKNEVQTLAGYPFSTEEGSVSATVDGKTYAMVTEGETAWMASEADEPGFVEALKAGSKLVVKGTSSKGNVISDTYSLSGFTAALNEIKKACS